VKDIIMLNAQTVKLNLMSNPNPMNLIEITLPPAEAIPFSLEAWQSGNYEVIYRNGEKPKAIYHILECMRSRNIISVNIDGEIETHDEYGRFVNDNHPRVFDLLLLPKAAAEPLRGKYVVVHKNWIYSEIDIAECSIHDNPNYHIIHFK
jgi:hypothetical protein